jgi:hypothetical protein
MSYFSRGNENFETNRGNVLRSFNIHKNEDTGKLTINIYITYNSRVDL